MFVKLSSATLRRLFRTFVLTTSTLLVASVPVIGAKALDWWIYPGSECVRWRGPEHIHLSASRLFNPSHNLELGVDCPVIVDWDAYPGSAWVDVIDTHKNEDVRCSLVCIGYNSKGLTGESTPTRSSSGFSNRVQRLHLNDMKGKSPIFSHCYFSCRVPPRDNGSFSGIVKYGVDLKD